MTSTATPLKGLHARRRLTLQLAKVQSLLDDACLVADDSLPGQVLFRSNARTPLFMLQALGRVYEKLNLDHDLFERIRLETKIIEDALGVIDFWNCMVKKCADWSMPAGATKLAQERYLEACGKAWAWLEAQEWVNCRYRSSEKLLAARFTRKLKKVDWLSPSKEAKSLRRWLHKELLSIDSKVQSLDLQQIEAGLHKSRRELRWISIYFTALEGAFVLDKEAKPPGHWDRYLTKEIIENPYNQLPVPEADDVPFVIPAPLLYALSYAIDRLGVIKDRALWTETLQHLLLLSGEKGSLPELMGENYLEDADATRQGAALLEQVLIKDRLLTRFAEAL